MGAAAVVREPATKVEATPDDVPAHSRAFRRRRFLNWFPLGITYAALYMGRYNFNVYRNHAQELHGLDEKQIGVVATAGFWVYALSVLINGPIAEKLGGRRAILVGVLGSSIVNLVIGLLFRTGAFPNVVVWLSVLYGINMYFQSFGALSVVKVNASWFHWRERGILGGVFGSMISLGYALAFSVCGAIYASAPYWAVFVVPSAVLFGMFMIDLVLVRDRPSLAGFADFDTGDAVNEPARAAGSPEPGFFHVVKQVLTNPVLVTLAIAEFCTGIVRQGLMLNWGRFMSVVHHVTEKSTPFEYQLASNGITVGGIAGALLCGVISDRLFQSRRAPVAFIFYAGQIVALIALGLAGSPVLACVLVAFSCMWIFGVHGMLSGTASMDFGGRRAAATAAGLLDGVQYLGSGFVGFGLGGLIKSHGWSIWPHVLTPFSFIGGLLMLRLWNARPARKAAH